MYLLSKTKIKNFLVVLLTLLLTISLAFIAACGKTSEESNESGGSTENNTETQETLTDSQVIKNGDFEFSTTEKTTFPYASSISWTRSFDSDKNSAPSSTANSGIIDTTDSVWATLKDNEKPKDAENNFVNPGTPYLKGLITLPEGAEETTEISSPQIGKDKNKILMINNKNSEEGLGTAQKFKSNSTITVPANNYAIVSLWVRTDNLKMKTGEKGGAYVLFTDKVGSTTYGNIEYRGINTNGEWKKIETVIEGSSFGSVSLTLTVGLGRGNATFKAEYVEGFAFFDNVEATIYTAKEFKELNKSYTFKDANKNNLNVEEYQTPTANNTLTRAYTFEYKDYGSNISEYTTNPLDAPYGWYQENIDPTKKYELAKLEGNKIDKKTISAIKNSTDASIANIKSALDDVQVTGLTDSDSVIYFNYAKASTGYYNTGLYDIGGIYNNNLDKAKYHYITFYAKTSVSNKNVSMAKVELVNITDDQAITSKVIALSSFTTENVENSAYGDWVKYSILISNPTDEDTAYRIRFVFGDNETNLINDKFKLQEGYAIFAGLSVKSITEENFNAITSNSQNVKLSVYGKYTNYDEPTTETDKQDSYFIKPDHYGNFEIQNRPATYLHGITVKGDRKSASIGIINSKYNSNYINDTNKVLTVDEANVFASDLKEGENTYAQTILFKDNNEQSDVSLIYSQKIISANTVGVISIKVRVVGDAVLKVRLVEATPNSNNAYESIKLTTEGFEKALEATVTKDTYKKGGYSEVFFYVAAGNKDIESRIELSFEKPGTAFVGALTEDLSSIATADDLDNEIDLLANDLEEIGLKLDAALTHKRAPTKILYTDDDGNDAEKIENYPPTEVYTTNGLYTFVKFTTVHVEDVIDNRTPDNTEEEDTTQTEDSDFKVTTDLGLQISSIVLAVALILVLLVVLVKKTSKKTVKRKATVESYYNRNTRDEAMAKIQKKKSQIILDKDENESEYNYDEAEAIEETVEEATEETTAEEVVEEAEAIEETSEETTDETPTEEVKEENTEATEETAEDKKD